MFNEDFFQKFRKVLVLGTGGGNDIVSATVVASYFTNRGIECDVAGILSPGAVHYFDGKLERVVNRIGDNVSRFIDGKKPKQISFVDANLPVWAREEGYTVGNFYDFSLRKGTEELVNGVNRLIEENGYDLLLGVDVGGDILGRIGKDRNLLSPQMDFSTLYLLGKAGVKSYLCEFGLGTDGELRPEGMREILKELREEGVVLSEGEIKLEDPETEQFKRLYEKVSKVRAGHTQFITLKTLVANPKEDLALSYHSRYNLGSKIIDNEFEVVIPKETFGKTFLLDAKKLAGLRTETAFGYRNSLEQFLRLKENAPEWKTEMDLCYTEISGKKVYVLTPSTNVPSSLRREILKEGLGNLERGEADYVLVLNRDKDYIGQNLFTSEVGKFVLVSTSSVMDEVKGVLEDAVC